MLSLTQATLGDLEEPRHDEFGWGSPTGELEAQAIAMPLALRSMKLSDSKCPVLGFEFRSGLCSLYRPKSAQVGAGQHDDDVSREAASDFLRPDPVLRIPVHVAVAYRHGDLGKPGRVYSYVKKETIKWAARSGCPLGHLALGSQLFLTDV